MSSKVFVDGPGRNRVIELLEVPTETLHNKINECNFCIYLLDGSLGDVYDDHLVNLAETIAQITYLACKMPKSTVVVLNENYIVSENIRAIWESTGMLITGDPEEAACKINQRARLMDSLFGRE
jgi:hypothetical protein